jgi:hypothetical protein
VILCPRPQNPTYATAMNYNNSIFPVLLSVATFWDMMTQAHLPYYKLSIPGDSNCLKLMFQVHFPYTNKFQLCSTLHYTLCELCQEIYSVEERVSTVLGS